MRITDMASRQATYSCIYDFFYSNRADFRYSEIIEAMHVSVFSHLSNLFGDSEWIADYFEETIGQI